VAASSTRRTGIRGGCWSAGCRRRATPRAPRSTNWWSVRGCAQPGEVPPGRRPARRHNSNAVGVNDLWRAISRRVRGGGGPSALAGASPHCHVGTGQTGTGAFGGDGGTAGASGCCTASQPRNSAHISSNTPVTGTPGRSQPWWRRACQSSHTPTPRSPAASSGSSTGRRCHSGRARAGAVHTPVVAGPGAGPRPAPVTAGRDWTGLRHAQSSPLGRRRRWVA